MTTSRRSLPSALIAGVLALLLSGVGGLLWLFGNGPFSLGGQTAEPQGAMFVPKQAPLMMSLVVNPDRLAGLRRLLAPAGKGRNSRKELKQLQDGLLAPANLDYGKDVKPWLGDEVTLAVTDLDLDHDAENGEQPGYLLALATQKPQRAREFLQIYWQRRAADGTRLRYETFNGVQVIYGEPALRDEAGKTVASALVGDRYILFANEPKVLRSAINNVQVPALNLLNSPRYRRALTALDSPRVGVLFANSNSLGKWVANQGLTVDTAGQITGAKTAASPSTSEAALISPSQGLYDGLAMSLGIDRRGLLADTALLLTDETAAAEDAAADAPELQSPEQALQYLPSNSAVAIASAHLDEFWQGTQSVLETYPAIATVANRAIGQLEAQWDVDFTQEIFPWVKGEYAIGQLERPRGPSDWVFVVGRDRPEARAGVTHLDDLAKSQGYSIGNLTLAEQEVTAWTKLKPEGEQDTADKALRALVRGVHATLGEENGHPYEVFATSLEAMESVLESVSGAEGQKALASSKGFQQAIAPLPRTNQGYLHLNWLDSEATLTEDFPVLRVLKLTAQPIFRNLKSVTLSGYERGEAIQRAAIFLRLGR